MKSLWHVIEVVSVVLVALILAVVVVVVVYVVTALVVVEYVSKLCLTFKFNVMLKKVNWTRVITEIVLLLAAVLGGAYNAETITSML